MGWMRELPLPRLRGRRVCVWLTRTARRVSLCERQPKECASGTRTQPAMPQQSTGEDGKLDGRRDKQDPSQHDEPDVGKHAAQHDQPDVGKYEA